MQHILLEIVSLGIKSSLPRVTLLATGAVLKIQISQPISAVEGILCGTESA
jgi:hypothetical protein